MFLWLCAEAQSPISVHVRLFTVQHDGRKTRVRAPCLTLFESFVFCRLFPLIFGIFCALSLYIPSPQKAEAPLI